MDDNLVWFFKDLTKNFDKYKDKQDYNYLKLYNIIKADGMTFENA